LRIAAGNVPNFADLATCGYGEAIQETLNCRQSRVVIGAIMMVLDVTTLNPTDAAR
jgi:hypothetical protein